MRYKILEHFKSFHSHGDGIVAATQFLKPLYVFGSNLLNEDYAVVRQDYTCIGRGIDDSPNMPRLIRVGLSTRLVKPPSTP